MNKGILGIIIVLIVSILIVGSLALGGKGADKPKEEGHNPGNDVVVNTPNDQSGTNEDYSLPGDVPAPADFVEDHGEIVQIREENYVFGGTGNYFRDGNFTGNSIDIKESYTLEDGTKVTISEDFQIEPSDYSSYKDGDLVEITGRSPLVAWNDDGFEAGIVTLDLSNLDFDKVYILNVSKSGLTLVIKNVDASKIVCFAEDVIIKTV